LEFEAAERLDQEQLRPLRTALSNPRPEMRKAALEDVEQLLGAGAARKVAGTPRPKDMDGYLSGTDLREPVFFVLQGRLHLLFLSIAGVAHQFEVLRAWHTELAADRRWSRIEPILAPGEHFWDVLVSPQPGRPLAYLTLYRGGGHYQFRESADGLIDLRSSRDGTRWTSVSKQGFIDRGRGCEPVLGFGVDGRAWMLLRLEDADRRGWGSLLGSAEQANLDRWTFARRADPQRFDSARFLAHGSELYLIARQNVGTDAARKLVETQNQPYGPTGTVAASNFRSLTLMTSYGLTPKRTALYRLDPKAGQFRWLLSLPSAGDTAFPSLERIAPDTWLLANYSNRVEERNLSWLEGQNQRTGVYLVLLRFPPPADRPEKSGPKPGEKGRQEEKYPAEEKPLLSGDAVLRGKAGASEIVLTTTSRVAGAIHSLTWNGREFLDSYDHGRQLQSASNLDLGRKFIPEVFNPTEAGSGADGTGPKSSSRLLRLNVSGGELTSLTRMAFWLAPGEKSEGHPAYNDRVLSDHLLAKRVRIGYKGLPHAIDYRVTFTIPKGEHHTFAQFEAVTGYTPPGFSRFWKYDAGAEKLRPLDDGPGEQGAPVVLATPTGSHAMGVYSPEQPSPGY
jgi:hypothetical protein